MPYVVLLLVACSAVLIGAEAQTKYVDQPVHAESAEAIDKIEAAIAPYIKKAKETFPAIRERYLKGLPAGSRLFITYKLHDGELFEVVFTKVEKLEAGKVFAVIGNNLNVVKSYHRGQGISFADGELIDWTIVDKDGEEEGNVVGKFLDTYKP